MWSDPSRIDLSLDSRAATFENPDGARGAGGAAKGGRKGAPSRIIGPGERVVLADLRGPGTIRHIWMTFPPAAPEVMRAQTLEVRYDGSKAPSIWAPCMDFFGMPHGRPVAYYSALTAAQEGRGFNAYFPMPFRDRVEVTYTNASNRPLPLYYQVDYTLEPAVAGDAGYLHAAFRRENPTTMKQDFVICDGLRGPGRFLGCVVGIRMLDSGSWYGEGEVKVFRDGDTTLPTICGTGLEDYAGSAWGMGAHAALYGGSPQQVYPPGQPNQPDFVGFYRWHLPDPIIFAREMRVTIQQIGFAQFAAGQDEAFAAYEASHPAAGGGWTSDTGRRVLARGIAERVDDYCATAFVYCREPQPAPALDVAAAVAGIGRLPYEQPAPFEAMFAQG
ncbi:MAG: DUF2961 domain-containing protein [Chloroflexi bacterium]|nr:DUF2961 domain-containing protein [Chloroflexota bacterium]